MTDGADRKSVVFDVGGVLLDWDPEYLYRKLIPDPEERGWFLSQVCSPEWNHAQDAGRSWSEAVATLSERFPRHAELIAAYDHRWEEMVDGAFEDTAAILENLSESGVPVFALTNFSAEKWQVALERWPFLQQFDGAVVSGDEGCTKPDPQIYRILLGRFRLEPERTFYVDDQFPNVEQARQQGMHAEVFVDAGTLRKQLVAFGVLAPKT